MRITIDVTRRDINNARRADERRDFYKGCPATCALWRALGVPANSNMGRGLVVGGSHIYFFYDAGNATGAVVLASLPREAMAFVDDFDDGIEVAPFSFVANFNKARAKRIGLALPGVAL